MMTVLSKRYVAPLIKALKPRVSFFTNILFFNYNFLKSDRFSTILITLSVLKLFFCAEAHSYNQSSAKRDLWEARKGGSFWGRCGCDRWTFQKNMPWRHFSNFNFFEVPYFTKINHTIWNSHSNISGGGSLGCQTLYHLAKLGVTNTVLLEKEQLTAGQPPYVWPLVVLAT